MRYSIEKFSGIQQHVDEHLLSSSASPEAVNMDAQEQDLQVAAGYQPYTTQALAGGIESLAVYYRREEGAADTRLLAANAGGLYEWRESGWVRLCSLSSGKISAVNYQHDGQDVLLIADGSGKLK